MSQATSQTQAPRLVAPRGGLLDDPRRLGKLMLAPTVIYIFGLVGLPFILAIVYSFTSVTVARVDFTFRGFDHYYALLERPAFWTALKNTLLYALVSQAIVMLMANILALGLMKNFRGKWFVRLLILLPFVAPISLGTLGWMWIFDPTYSVLNWMAQAVHILGPGERFFWLGEPNLARASLIMINVWRTLPLATVILLAGLGSIPQDIHDAAQMDGARFWRHHFQITLPLITPIMAVATLFGLVFTFTDIVVIFVLTRGGPFDSTHVLASLAYYTGIEAGDLAEGAAISLFLFPLLLAIAIAMLRLAKRSEIN
ncbi:MAG TPA: sugar ABC transporter permease [bacterium]